MAPRLNKRQLREMAELAELSSSIKVNRNEVEDDVEEEEDEADNLEEMATNQRLNSSIFDMLNNDSKDDEEEEEDDDEAEAVVQVKKSKNKKKKKKTTTIINSTTSTPNSIDQIPSSSSTPSKKSTNKSNTSTSKSPLAGIEGMDEIDLALAEIAQKNGVSELPTIGSTSTAVKKLNPMWKAVQDSFSFDPKFLDPDVELRKMFGSKVVNSTPVIAPRSRHHARLANNPHHAVSMRRTSSYLATPEPGWSPPKGILTLKTYTGIESLTNDQGEWFTFEHSVEYRESQLKFLEILQQADGNRLYNVLESNPYHVDTLMQLSEMMIQQGDLDLSSKHLSKALYALSTPLPPSFLTGSFRLPYSQVENRAFFLGISRKVTILTKRGTWRTACEWCKIALGTGGEADPVGMLMFIDVLAPKAKEHNWLLSTITALNTAYPEMKVLNYPGLAFGKALCIRNLEEENSEDDTKSTAALKSAIIRFPMVAYLLYSALGGNMPPKLVSHRRAQLDGSFTSNPSYLLSLLSTLYVARSSPIWKEPKLLSWLQKTTILASESLDDSTLEDVKFGEKLWNEGGWPKGVAPAGIIRGAFLSEIPTVKPYLPPSATSGTSYSFDPLPPPRATSTFYDQTYFSPLHQARSSRRSNPNQQQQAAVPRGMQAAMRAQLAAMLGFGGNDPVNMTDELREELMRDLEILDNEAAEGGAAPGGFPDSEEDENDDEEEGEGEEVRREGILGRLAAMLGGGRAA